MYRYIIIFILVLLAGCSLPGTQTESSDIIESTVLFENSELSMLVPRAWSGTQNTHTINLQNGIFIAGFISPDIKSGFSNNLIIMKDTLENIMTSEQYSTINNLQTKKNYLEYIAKKDEIFHFSDDETSRLYIFEAKYNESTPRMQYIQTARVCGSNVYLLHFLLSVDKKADVYTELLKSFTCK